MKHVSYSALALSCLLAGCVTGPGAVKEISDRQQSLEASVDRLSKALTDVQRRLEIQGARIKNLEQNYSDLYLKIDDFQSQPSAQAPAKQQPAEVKEKSERDLYLRAGNLYSEGQYLNAILAYQVFIDTYPNDKRVADAYLKQGLSLVRIGRRDGAKYFFKTLIDRFPGSPEAETAREELKKLDSN